MEREHKPTVGQKGPKRGSLSPAKKGAILAKATEGKSQRQIAREVGCNRKTVARLLSSPEIKAMLEQTSSQLHELLPEAVATYKEHLEGRSEESLHAATNLLVGLQVFTPKTQRRVVHSTPLEEELERRCLAGRSLENLQYFAIHGYFPEEAHRCADGK